MDTNHQGTKNETLNSSLAKQTNKALLSWETQNSLSI